MEQGTALGSGEAQCRRGRAGPRAAAHGGGGLEEVSEGQEGTASPPHTGAVSLPRTQLPCAPNASPLGPGLVRHLCSQGLDAAPAGLTWVRAARQTGAARPPVCPPTGGPQACRAARVGVWGPTLGEQVLSGQVWVSWEPAGVRARAWWRGGTPVPGPLPRVGGGHLRPGRAGTRGHGQLQPGPRSCFHCPVASDRVGQWPCKGCVSPTRGDPGPSSHAGQRSPHPASSHPKPQGPGEHRDFVLLLGATGLLVVLGGVRGKLGGALGEESQRVPARGLQLTAWA